ncbi:heavy-metal-associated domain-containing protein [Novosphingobium mangrovi (ex Huang et al. 2023)]|uniref:Heavy-metal-associated domain-containing protein n=1 Tax=Novosphingobium mangrovi (ex Huang et al. 2023) TaxID=2976432 RepID=A0ABT2I6N5_9SPHN|nr:heavy-metal-associated domain-containing protein [Novosphingobium mangrovi (ex Huang et al. 2023)]MCT2400480.1 heavy-metal-associated domain-containing protein [Novosphingobium mangrovi (ex Huang et al. 2023)]
MAMTISPKILRLGRNGARLGQGRRTAALVAGAVALAAAGIGGVRLAAQIEGDRGIAPLANSEDIQVNGIDVDVTAKNGAEARLEGWKEAEKKAWKKLGGPDMPLASIDAMVSSVVIEHEQVGPQRYVARLGVIFDKTKAGQFVGGPGGAVARSAPMLVIPVLYSGGVRQVFEVRGPWQQAWAEFQAASSPVDYVRPAGSGGESLVLTAGQTSRRSRLWWSTLLGQFDAADVVMPVARLERQWPGGPIKGTFTARYGLDNTFLGSFTMMANSEQDLQGMLDQAVVRVDGLYRDALSSGVLKPDPTLRSGRVALDRAFDQLRAALMPQEEETPVGTVPQAVPQEGAQSAATAPAETVSVQFATPDAAAVDAALAAVRGVPGVQGAATVSLAIGGTSVMRVTVAGGADRLAGALRAQGWNVSSGGGGGALRISR